MLNNVPIGKKAPDEVNVIIEIPAHSDPVKYEVDKETGALFVDRFMTTAMHYPCDYGYIPETLGLDGDPLDVVVVAPLPLITGTVLSVRPIGVLNMQDEAGDDCKLIAVPITKLTQLYQNIEKPEDLHQITLDRIAHFFQHYKDLDQGKWVKTNGWSDAEAAKKIIVEGQTRYQQSIN